MVTDIHFASTPENPVFSGSQTKLRRIMSIDLFRGFLLCFMVIDHFLLYWGNENAMQNGFYCLVNDGIAGWGAGGFLMMMGASQALSSKRLNIDNQTLLKKTLLRGVYLFGVGLIMILLSFGPDDIWRWDILTLMGTATVLLYFLRSMSSWSIILIVAAILLATPLIRSLPAMDFQWEMVMQETPFLTKIFPGMFWDPTREPEFLWQADHILKGFFVWGEFPIFPWLTFPLLGLIAGRRIVENKFQSDILLFVLSGAFLVFLGFTGAYLARFKTPLCVIGDYITPFCFYPDSFTMSIYQTGITILIFSLLFFIFDVKLRGNYQPGFIAQIMKRTSNFSLTFYFLHYMLVGWPLLAVQIITGESHEMNFLGFLPSLTFGITSLLALEILIYFWEKNGNKFSLEWILILLTKRIFSDYERKL